MEKTLFGFLTTYFSGDDFFHLKAAVTDGSREQFLRFFVPLPITVRGYAFYRPLFREVLYHLFHQWFGLNPTPFRVLQLILFLANVVLVYLLTQRLFRKRAVSLLTTFLYGLSAAHLGALYYLAGGVQALGATFFILLSLLLSEKQKIISGLCFVAALASHELAVAGLPLLVGWSWARAKNFKWQDYLQFLPHTIVLMLYLYVNFFIIGFSSGETAYRLNFSLSTLINTLGWYTSWSLGLPEMTVDFVGSGLKLNPNLMRFWGDYYRIIWPAFFTTLAILVTTAAVRFKALLNKKFLFLLLWFLVGLLPVIFLPIHKKTYYLQLSLPAFWGLVGYLFFKIKSQPIRTLLVLALVTLQVTTAALTSQTYWAANRGRVAQRLVSQVQDKYPTLPSGAVIYFKNDPDYPVLSGDWEGSSKQAFFALNGDDALQLAYHDLTLKVYYEDVAIPPADQEVFELVAKLSR